MNEECKVFDFINRRDVCVNKDMLMMIKYLRGYIKEHRKIV